ncbi:MAG TPA: MBL fold metallo-hydrolase [Bryobacteraceae bacterium]|nr:MBL fold metallo-hydrolase [Bryobacterales bacterium]HRJ18272.1 MBL fold metallo-hydrolase [Bryobacteraceae bacterium]
MIRETMAVGLLQCNCTILGDETTREAIVVDPGDGADLTRLQTVLAGHGLTVKAIVITHAHIDHIGGAAALKALTGAPIYMNSNDRDLYHHLDVQAGWLNIAPPERTEIDADARDGDSLRLGETPLHLLHTPGHTQGSVCLFCPAEHLLIAGDTLFRDSIGRTDLPGGDGHKILDSIHTRLLTLPEETEVICGHGPGTTIGREKERNPFLRPGVRL